MECFRVGVDIGGTFTDVVLAGPESVHQAKVLSTPHDLAAGVLDGLRLVLRQAAVRAESIHEVVHGTTVATNAILEQNGAVTALLTTRGFRDVLEIGRMRRPSLSDIYWEKPHPLVPRRLRFELDERIDGRGNVERGVQPAEVDELAPRLRDLGVESIAVCLLNSYINPAHEQRVQERLREALPNVSVSTSVDVLPEIKEYERTSTTVVNAYIKPTVMKYITGLNAGLKDAGVQGPLLVMQSNGGLLDSATACAAPVRLIESGPAAGVIATKSLAKRLGLQNVIAFDMGGTTAKASLVENGEPFVARELEVGGGMNGQLSLMRGDGYTVRAPSIDISEVGAGGGSICWVDAGGAPRVGPRSAGAVPGPACYGRGGTEPTLTDALVVLGYLNPKYLAGGVQPIDPIRAQHVIEEAVAQPLRLETLEAAYGIYTIAIATMCKAVRSVSSQRGRDPRQFSLVAFGGAGPAHAVEIARSLNIPSVIVPRSPGLFSAIGLLVADVQYHDVWSCKNREHWDLAEVTTGFSDMERRALARAGAGGTDAPRARIERFADLRYLGQSFELRVPVPAHELAAHDLTLVRERFHAEHRRTYGHQADDAPVEIVNLRLIATLTDDSEDDLDIFTQGLAATPRSPEQAAKRSAYFGPAYGRAEIPVLAREMVGASTLRGPAIIEDDDATTVVPPGSHARLDALGNIEITVGVS
jgi:N-methylhydantoinase A